MAYRLPDPANKAEYLRDKFDQIARCYDLFNDLITQGQHRLWKNFLVRRLAPAMNRPRTRGLDLCCGTGDIALRSEKKLRQDGVVYALDFSQGMLQAAKRRRSGTAGGVAASRVMLQGDAMRLPFPDSSLDFVTVGYGLRNVSGLRECLEEILRVLRPDGMLGTLDVGKVRAAWLRPLADFYFFRIVPLVGRMLQPGQDMFNYLPESSLNYPGQDALRELMLEMGFVRVELKEYLFGASVVHLATKPGFAPTGAEI